MNQLYLIKFKATRIGGVVYKRLGGHTGPQSWGETAQWIATEGVAKLQWVKHHDKEPKNYRLLDGKEMLALWKSVTAVESKATKNKK